jgi:hypothetical protein
MIIRFLVSTGLGLVLGILVALGLAFGPTSLGGLRVGPWQTDRLIGSVDADPIVRAVIARRGLLALRQSETVYFSADDDDDSRPLDAGCQYQVRFAAEPQARWWSVTLYAEDDYLAVNGDEAHSFSADHVAADPEGRLSVTIAATRPEGDGQWVSASNAGAFNLTMRFYHPDDVVLADAAAANLPAIERLMCEGEA